MKLFVERSSQKHIRMDNHIVMQNIQCVASSIGGLLTLVASKDNRRKRCQEKVQIGLRIKNILKALLDLSKCLELNMARLICDKMESNRSKYPTKKCLENDKIDKSVCRVIPPKIGFSGKNQGEMSELSTFSLEENIRSFGVERGWERHYTDLNLSIALISEMGELAELYEWNTKKIPIESINKDTIKETGREIADVCILLFHLARINDIPLLDLSLN